MRRVLVLLLLIAASPAAADPPIAQARAEGKALGEAAGRAAADLANDDAAAVANLDGYNGGNAPESTYLGNPNALGAAAITTSRTNAASVLVIDGDAIRPKIPKIQVDETVARGDTINLAPDTYVRGVDPQGTTGQCVDLPPSTTNSPGNYEATCNVGAKVINEPRTCAVPLDVTALQKTVYDYECGEEQLPGIPACTPVFDAQVGSGTCQIVGTRREFRCLQWGGPGWCTEPDWITVNILECSAPVPSRPVPAPRQVVSVSAVKNEAICTAATQGLTCTNPVEVCTDSNPTTRIIDGVPVTQPCWKWDRTYNCQGVTQGNTDCGALKANRQCTYLRTDCLDDPPQQTCQVEQKVFSCPIPGGVPGPPQTVCGGDVYCIGGECEAVTREASDEFKDAAVGLETLAQVNREFDSMDFKLFKGTAMSCHKPVFGLVNCCAGKSSGLIPVATGAAALAAGPVAIAGLATPFLTLFLCKPSEMELDVRDRMGLCHEIGWYCSGSFLGICHSRRRSSCCFLSKLTRILQEQGRAQLNKGWGTAKKPDCAGFTIDEFASLDLSKMDFTEVYKEFVEAAKLPNEAATMADIQAKIVAYYSRNKK